MRPVMLCRSWLFLEGANEDVLQRAASSGADVPIQELEDFTPPALRPAARAIAGEFFAKWREAGAVVAVRVNPLEQDGMDDLASVMRGRPDIVALPKVAEPSHVARLDRAVSAFERDYGIPEGSTALLPDIEFARGLVQTGAIAKTSSRVAACLLASEDLAADLGAEQRTRWPRARLLPATLSGRVRRGRRGGGGLSLYLERCRRRKPRYALCAASRLWRKKPGRSGACRHHQRRADAE
jgi:citrate lyase subunit beta/citryl-CoA lyase